MSAGSSSLRSIELGQQPAEHALKKIDAKKPFSNISHLYKAIKRGQLAANSTPLAADSYSTNEVTY